MKSFIPWRKCKLHVLLKVCFLVVCAACLFGFYVLMYLPGWLDEVRNYYDGPSTTNNKTPGAFSSTNYDNNRHEDEDDEAVDSSINYGVVIDCGSSGSRLFVYYWQQHTGEPNQLLDIKILKDANNKTVVSKIEPGLSSYSKTPSQASDYIAPLLKFAQDHIPAEKIKETPLYILATAGMRLLPKEEQTALLNDLRTDIGLDFDFLFSPAHIEVISGKWEGIYGWTAVNHALGKFNHKLSDDSLVAVDVGNKVHIRKRTVGMLDLGGASLQMTFEIPQTHSYIDSKIKEHVVEFNLGCTSSDSSHIYKIYSRTFLGYGSNEGRQRYSDWLVNHFKHNISTMNHEKKNKMAADSLKAPQSIPSLQHTNLTSNITNSSFISQTSSSSSSTSSSTSTTLDINDPCLSLSYSEIISNNGTDYKLNGTGDLSLCIHYLKAILNKSKNCFLLNKRRCSMDGVILPDINYGMTEFYGFSEFFYTMHDILQIGGPYIYHHYLQKAKEYCQTNWLTVEEWKKSLKHPRADSQRYRLQCFKSAWMLSVLHDGLNFPHMYRHLTSIQYIDNYEIHWSLGALLHKTKYFPLRNIEKASQKLSKKLTQPKYSANTAIIFICLLLLLTVLLYCCSLYMWPAKSRRQVTISVSTDETDEHIVDTKSYDSNMKMIRSRSYGFFANSAQNIV